jgi:hypothetical protein
LLQTEVELEKTPAAAVASLCCEALLAQPNRPSEVVTSVSEIKEWYPESRGYFIDPEIKIVLAQQLYAPYWNGGDTGSSLKFCIVVSSFPNYQVRRVTVNLPHDGTAECSEGVCSDEVIVERVFAQTPVTRR